MSGLKRKKMLAYKPAFLFFNSRPIRYITHPVRSENKIDGNRKEISEFPKIVDHTFKKR